MKAEGRNDESCKESILPYLPYDVVICILSKLPAKSLLRFKCVCKAWLSLLSKPQFIRSHLNIIISSSYSSEGFGDYIAKFGAAVNGVVDAEKIDHLSEIQSQAVIKYIGSSNGLVCFTYKPGSILIYNPITRVDKEILFCGHEGVIYDRFNWPEDKIGFDYHEGRYKYGFGYDHVNDDYKVVKEDDRGFHVYSLRNDCWKTVADQDLPCHKTAIRSGALLNGAIHWLLLDTDLKPLGMVAFDLVDEKFRDIPLPDSFGLCDSRHSIWFCWGVKLLGGCLCIVPPVRTNEFFVMKEYGVKHSWTKIEIKVPYRTNIEPLALFENDEALLLTDYGKLDYGKLILYNTREGTYRNLVVRGIPDDGFIKVPAVYMESLVSPLMAWESQVISSRN